MTRISGWRCQFVAWKFALGGLLVCVLLGRLSDTVLSVPAGPPPPSLSRQAEPPVSDGAEPTPQVNWKDWTAGPRVANSHRTHAGSAAWMKWFAALGQRSLEAARTVSQWAWVFLLACAVPCCRPARAEDVFGSLSAGEYRAGADPVVDPLVIPVNAFDDALDSLGEQAKPPWRRCNICGVIPMASSVGNCIRVQEPHHYPRIPWLDKDGPETCSTRTVRISSGKMFPSNGISTISSPPTGPISRMRRSPSAAA